MLPIPLHSLWVAAIQGASRARIFEFRGLPEDAAPGVRMLARSHLFPVAVCVAVFVLAHGSARSGALTGPIADEGLTVVVEDLIQLPASRINVLREAPDGSQRLFVNDLQGRLFVIEGGTASVYMNFNLLFPEFSTAGIGGGLVSFAHHPEFGTNGLFYTTHSEDPDPTVLHRSIC